MLRDPAGADLPTPEHIHTDACFEAAQVPEANPQPQEEPQIPAAAGDPGADVEGEADWNAMIARLSLTGNYREDVLTIAASQVGYTESARNFVVDPDSGRCKGYTRFGAWYGMPYADWCAMFVAFCLHYAGITEDRIPRSAACDRWADLVAERGLAIRPTGVEGLYEPRPGDLVFFRLSGGTPDHIGLVEGFDAESKRVHTIEGNYSASVSRVSYELDDPRIALYCPLPEQDGAVGPNPAEPDEEALHSPDNPETAPQIGRSPAARVMSAPPARGRPGRRKHQRSDHRRRHHGGRPADQRLRLGHPY